MWRKAIPGASRAANLSARRLLGTSRRHLSRAPWPPPPEGPGRFVALWGNGDYGRLGLGSLSSQWRPAACTFFADDDPPVSVACGGAHTLFLTGYFLNPRYQYSDNVHNDPEVRACTLDVIRRLARTVDDRIEAEREMEPYRLRLGTYGEREMQDAIMRLSLEKGHVFATGLNNFGQLGITTDTSHTLVPIKVSMFPKKILQIAAGYHHSAAITEDGELFVWGNNSNGQLGLGRKAESFVSAPTRVDCLVGACVKMVALGSEHSIAVTDEGNALSWGAGGCGRLGHGLQSGILGFSGSSSEYTPRLIKNFEEVKVKKIAAGLLHSACIDERGCVFVFGEETTGKLAFGALKNTSTPSIVHELPFSEEIACGGYHTCVITAGGQLYTWGSNENGCLGLGFTDMVDTPQRVENSFMKFPISEVSCGWKHAAVISGGNLLTWGWGGANGTFFEDGLSSGGQLGHGNDLDCFEPMAVNIGKHVRAVQVSGGFNHTGAIFEFV